MLTYHRNRKPNKNSIWLNDDQLVYLVVMKIKPVKKEIGCNSSFGLWADSVKKHKRKQFVQNIKKDQC